MQLNKVYSVKTIDRVAAEVIPPEIKGLQE